MREDFEPAAGPRGVRRPAPMAVVAIPARDEASCVPACLHALAIQEDAAGRAIGTGTFAVLLLANNCRDGTAAVARAMAPSLPYPLIVREAELPPGRSHAGGARRAAMDAAAALLDTHAPGAVILSTDADGLPEPGWLQANLSALAAGADAVAGSIRPDPAQWSALPQALREREAREARYATLLDEIAARLDPDPHDPWPRHGIHSGASIALTLGAYRRVGGLPEVPVGEDRALFLALLRADMRVRHLPDARVTVSCRLDGRAAGGMADTMRSRLREEDAAPTDPRLEPARDAFRRFRRRRALRRLRAGRGDPRLLARALGLSTEVLASIAARPGFWRAWEELEAAAPALRRRSVAAGALNAEAARAAALLSALRAA